LTRPKARSIQTGGAYSEHSDHNHKHAAAVVAHHSAATPAASQHVRDAATLKPGEFT